jgi:molybdopterin molybdotransferase
MTPYEDALRIIKDEIKNVALTKETLPLSIAVNKILAEDIAADVDLPPFDNSAVDGFAIQFSNRKSWNIIGEISAGNYKEVFVDEASAVLITTGSKLPASVDTVIPVEDVVVEKENIFLRENFLLKKGINIRKKGSDLKKDFIALQKFTKLGAAAIAAAASCGKENVSVFKPLAICVLSTGDELIPIKEKPAKDKLRVSNLIALCAAITILQHTAKSYGFLPDDKKLIHAAIAQMLADENDIIITTGGVSVGKYDFIKEIFLELGVEIKFWKANIKPGKPIVFGVYKKNQKTSLVFGLPGNPVSALVNFEIFIKPALLSMVRQPELDITIAELQNELKKKDTKRHFLRGILFTENGVQKVKSQFSQSSGNLVELANANALIIIKEEVSSLQKGSMVECIRI